MSRDLMLLLPLGLVLSLALMLVTWVVAKRLRNAGVVDVSWAGGFCLLVVVYALFAGGDPLRRLLIAFMVALWSLRLATHLFFRVSDSPKEDARYTRLRERWGADADRRMFGFFLFQGLLQFVLSIPFLVICLNRTPELRWVEWLGFVLWMVGLAGETAADWQLARFKSDPDNHGRTFQDGLWRLSRHPNYFFELVVWTAWFITGLAWVWGWLMVFAPLLMWHFLLKVTGIPATEQEALRTKGEEYRRYQQTTNMLVPWFPKEK
jgi:steroid 5-alpha reductase family enzyme